MLLKNDFSWNGTIRIGEIVSAFRCWQFSPSSFFSQKNTTKKFFFVFFFTDVNSSQKEINVPFWCKKESHFDRCICRPFLFLHIFHSFWKVGVLDVRGPFVCCTYRGFLFLHYFYVPKMQKILYLFWFLQVIFGLTGAMLCYRILLKSGLLSKFQNFLHILSFVCVFILPNGISC